MTKFRIGGRVSVVSVGALGVMLAASSPGFGQAGKAMDRAALARAFGSREDVRQISMSPDGLRVAFIASRNPSGERLFIADVAGGAPRAVMSSAGKDQHLRRCSWVNDARLVCNVSYQIDRGGSSQFTLTRLMAVDLEEGKVQTLEERSAIGRSLGFAQSGGTLIDLDGGEDGTVLLTQAYVPENTAGTRVADKREGLGVVRVDAQSLRRKTVERPEKNAVEYISDGAGHVRIMGLQADRSMGYKASWIDYKYRLPGSDAWQDMNRLEFDGNGVIGFNPYAVDGEENVVYGFQNEGGYQALYKMHLDGSGRIEKVFARDGVDVDGLVRIGRERRVVGASWADTERHSQIFDPELASLRAKLSVALPEGSQISILDASEGEGRLLLEVGSDVAPGTIYFFDKKARQLGPLLDVRSALAGMALSPMKPVTYTAQDGTQIPAYLTLPPGATQASRGLPAIVMPHGGPAARDEWGFDWLVQYFAQSGYAVLQPNYRGSAGYGDAWLEKNGFQSWKTAIGDIDDAGRWLVSQGIADADKMAIVGWSYGGYAALQSGVSEPGLFKAIVAVAPVTDLAQLREDSRDYANFELVDRMIGTGPHVERGSPARHAEAMAVPVLMFSGNKDENVDVGQARLMEARLKAAGKPVTYVEFDGLSHQLDDTEARTRVLSESDAFLRHAMGLN